MHKSIYIPFIFLVMLFNPINAVSAERDKYNRMVDAAAFKSKLSGTSWIYNWNDRDFTFGFSPDGTISKLKGRSKVKWSFINEMKLF